MELEIKNQSDQITHLALRGRLDTAESRGNRIKVYQSHGPKGKAARFGHFGSHFSFLLRLADALDRRESVGSPWGQNGSLESAASCA